MKEVCSLLGKAGPSQHGAWVGDDSVLSNAVVLHAWDGVTCLWKTEEITPRRHYNPTSSSSEAVISLWLGNGSWETPAKAMRTQLQRGVRIISFKGTNVPSIKQIS